MASARSLMISPRTLRSPSSAISRSQISPYLQAYLSPKLSARPITPAYAYLTRSLYTTRPVWVPSQTPTPSQDVAAVPSTTKEKEKGVTTSSKEKKGTRMQRIWASVKKEASHYWHGTKLLGKEIRISARIQGRLLAGKKLTRREHRQLKRTTQDLLRLIPFSVFLIVPFMELLLPVALKLFPNMLPSTFTDKFKEDEKKRKLLKVRLEMAKFLQETIRESGIKSPDKIKESEDFKEFFRKVRSTGESPTTDEVVNVSRLFEDDLTLDNLSRPQLVSMCRYMNINAFGTDNFLRYTIRSRMKKLKEDDKVIDSEGISALSLPELQAACQSRGIRSLGVDEEHLRNELGQWVDLHLNRGLSGTLLILSKAFAFNRPIHGSREGGEGDDIMNSVKDTLASLPDNLLNETELEVSSDSASYKQRLEVLQQQEELIEDEEEQEQKESDARRLKKEAEEDAKREENEQKEREEIEEKEKVADEKEQAEEMLPEKEVDSATEELPKEDKVEAADVRMTSEQVTELGQALEILSAKSSVIKERTELRKLIAENKEAEVDGGKPNPLAKRLKGILAKIDQQLEEYDNEVGGRLNMFETDKEGKIAVKDLKSALEIIRHRPSDEQIEILLEKLDVDHDSFVPLQDIISLAEGEGLGIVIGEEEHPAAAELVEKVSDVKEAADQLGSSVKNSTSRGESERSAAQPVQTTERKEDDESKDKEKKKEKKDEKPKLKKEDIVES